MIANPHRTLGARLLVSVMLNFFSPPLENVPRIEFAPDYARRVERSIRRELAGAVPVRHFVRDRKSVLNSEEPRFVRARACLFPLLLEGYDRQLLDYWLDALSEDTIVEGMPGDLIVAFYGEPLERRSVIFEGGRAERWSIVRKANQEEQVIVSGGKVVRIGA